MQNGVDSISTSEETNVTLELNAAETRKRDEAPRSIHICTQTNSRITNHHSHHIHTLIQLMHAQCKKLLLNAKRADKLFTAISVM